MPFLLSSTWKSNFQQAKINKQSPVAVPWKSRLSWIVIQPPLFLSTKTGTRKAKNARRDFCCVTELASRQPFCRIAWSIFQDVVSFKSNQTSVNLTVPPGKTTCSFAKMICLVFRGGSQWRMIDLLTRVKKFSSLRKLMQTIRHLGVGTNYVSFCLTYLSQNDNS